jgi:hypothetical protein
MIAKPTSIKDAKRKSGGCARKAVELTSGDLLRVAKSRLGMVRTIPTAQQKSAKGIVPETIREGLHGPRKGRREAVSRRRDS